jgi:hypothetical protein
MARSGLKAYVIAAAAGLLFMIFAGCGFSEYAQWQRSLLLPQTTQTSATSREATYDYKCPPDYHLIPCPTCHRPIYRTDRRCRRGADCDYETIPYREEQFPCAFCQGSPFICEPDGYDRGKNIETGKP